MMSFPDDLFRYYIINGRVTKQKRKRNKFSTLHYLISTTEPMIIIVKEPEILVYHRVGHNIDKPLYYCCLQRDYTARLGLGHVPHTV